MAVTPNSIITPQAPKSNAVGLTTANTTFSTSPTNTALLITAGANGARVTKLQFVPLENVTANNLQCYRDLATAGVSKYFFLPGTGGSDTVSGTDPPAVVDTGCSDDNPIILQPLERVYVATGITKNYHAHAEWADY